jgi:hypothetical protein
LLEAIDNTFLETRSFLTLCRNRRLNCRLVAAAMPMSWRCRPLRVREGCVSAGKLRESVVSVILLLPQFTAIGLSVAAKAFVILHFFVVDILSA